MKNLSTFALTLTSLSLAGLPAATTPTIEERVKALEEQVQGLATENTQLKQQLGWKGSTAPVLPTPGGKETKLIVGGFLQGQAEFGRATDPRWSGVKDRFFFRRARIYLAGSFAEDFDFKAELDLQGNTLGAGTGQLARANEIYITGANTPTPIFASVSSSRLTGLRRCGLIPRPSRSSVRFRAIVSPTGGSWRRRWRVTCSTRR